MMLSPIFLAFVAPPNTCGHPTTCRVPHCAKCGGGAHGTPQFCLQCCPGYTPTTGSVPECTGSPAIYWQSSPTVANSTLLVAGANLAGAAASLCADATCTGAHRRLGQGDRRQLLLVVECDPGVRLDLTLRQRRQHDLERQLPAAPRRRDGRRPRRGGPESLVSSSRSS